MKIISSIISLSLWQTVVSAAGHDEDHVASFISQRRNLVLKNAARYGVTRSSISSKASDTKAKEKAKAILSLLHGKQVSDGSACIDAYEKMLFESYYNDDLDIYEFSDFDQVIDNIYAWSIDDQSAFEAYTDACEALDGRVGFLNFIADNCYYLKFDEDFNITLNYLSPLETEYHLPDCIPNACTTNNDVVNSLESMVNATDYGEKCKLKIEVSEEVLETTEEKLDCMQATADILFNGTMWTDEFFDRTIDYDEDTNTMTWIGSDEDLASFDTACQALGGSTYLTSGSSDECYYYDYYDYTFSEDKLVDWIRLPDCLPKTCSSTKVAVDTLEMLYYSAPNCDSKKIKLDLPNGCKDSGVKMLLKRDGVTKKRGCEFILRKESLREKRCGLKEVASHCPSTCNEVANSCTEYSCEDSKMKWTLWGKNDKSLDCDWVKVNPEKRCKKNGVAATCRKTCGYKSDFLDCSN